MVTNRGISLKMTSPFARSLVANAPQPATVDFATLKKSFSNSAAGESLRVRCMSGLSIDIWLFSSEGGDASSSFGVSEITERQSMAQVGKYKARRVPKRAETKEHVIKL